MIAKDQQRKGIQMNQRSNTESRLVHEFKAKVSVLRQTKMNNWSSFDVQTWLEFALPRNYSTSVIPTFQDHNIDGKALVRLNEHVLQTRLHFDLTTSKLIVDKIQEMVKMQSDPKPKSTKDLKRKTEL